MIYLIIKKREIPIDIIKLQALLRRIRPTHPKRPQIEADLAKKWAGYRGELTTDYYLQELSEKDYYIFHDLRYPSGKNYFQIDTLVITNSFALLIETKNISGTLTFNRDFHQIIQTKDNTEKGYQDPISQGTRHQRLFKKLLQNWGIDNLPIITLAVISKPSTILKAETNRAEVSRKVCFAFEIPEKVELLRNHYREGKIDPKELKRLRKNLVKYHASKEFDPLPYYQIPQSDIITGVQCPEDATFGMVRKHGTWVCPKCNYQSKDAHIPAIQDFLLLVDSNITNKKCCEFLHLASSDIAKYLLSTMNLAYSGSNKARIYFLKGMPGKIKQP
ncbi:nuclease-related domain-containing protein [Neobacillus sp. Marseille-QA0830]